MNELRKKPLFNPEGDTDVRLRRMINGNTTNLNDFNNMRYPWVSDWYRQAMNNFWIPEEINLSTDVKDYPRLSPAERTAYDKILSFLVFLDSIQTANLPHIGEYITANEVRPHRRPERRLGERPVFLRSRRRRGEHPLHRAGADGSDHERMESCTMNLGFLYAGQGSQHPGMGADLYERFPTFRAVLDSAAARVDFDLKEVSFTDAKGVLNQTRYTQPCMVAFAAGMTALLAERGIIPAAAAGLSLGEYSALHAAGVFDADTAVELVAFRGKAMEEAAAGRPSAMVAVLGLDRAALQAACNEAAKEGCVVIANYNCPGQLVLGGEKAAVEAASALAKEKGARRCLPLKVSGPFHTQMCIRDSSGGLRYSGGHLPAGKPGVPHP